MATVLSMQPRKFGRTTMCQRDADISASEFAACVIHIGSRPQSRAGAIVAENQRLMARPGTRDSLPVPQPTQSELQLTVRNCTV